jgi:hypothetical protein
VKLYKHAQKALASNEERKFNILRKSEVQIENPMKMSLKAGS